MMDIEKIARDHARNFYMVYENTFHCEFSNEEISALINEIIEMCALEVDLKVVNENKDEWTITREMAFKRASEAIRNLKG